MNIRHFIAAFIIAGSLTGDCAAMKMYRDYGSKYFEPTEEVVTPHIRWAKPLAGGPLKVLFITNHKATREVIELAQRLDMTYAVFATEMAQEFTYPGGAHEVAGTLPAEYERRLRDKLAGAYDVIVMANVAWDILPEWSRQEILKQIDAGTGFVGCIRHGLTDDLLKLQASSTKAGAEAQKFSSIQAFSPFPYLALPEFALGEKGRNPEAPAFMQQIIDTYQYGHGRVVMIRGWNPPVRQMITPAYVGNPLDVKMLHYDYHLSFTIRMMLWAGRRTPTVKVRSPIAWEWGYANQKAMYRDDLSPIGFNLQSEKGCTVRLDLTVRDHDNLILDRQRRRLELAEGDNLVRFDLAALPAGVHFVDLWVKDSVEGKVIDFGTASLEVRSLTHLRDISLAADHFQKEAAVRGMAMVANATGAERLIIERFDNHDRWVGSAHLAVPASTSDGAQLVPFEISAHDVRTVRQEVRIKLMRGTELLDTWRKAFSISDLYPRDDVRITIFATDSGRCYTDMLFMREVARAGFDSVWANPSTRQMVYPATWANLYRLCTDFGPNGAVPPKQNEAGPVRYACLTDPNVIGETRRAVRDFAEHMNKFSNREFSLASEGGYVAGHSDTANACFSPTCIQHFQHWLKSSYGTLANLNAEYGTSYTTWEKIIPISLSEAKAQPNLLPLWVDHRRHTELVWAGWFARNSEFYRNTIPNARVGWQCSGAIGRNITSYQAIDYWALYQATSLVCNYEGPFVVDAARDFTSAGAMVGGGCWGYAPSPYRLRWAPWQALLRGANAMLVFRSRGHVHTKGTNTGNSMNMMAPDLSWYDEFGRAVQEHKEIKRGIGKLLMHSQRSDDGIAVMYSASSNHVGAFTDGLPTLADTLRIFPHWFEDTGFQYRNVSYQQVAEGILQSGQFRVLYLPYCQAMSQAEATQIASFVQAGGSVIADLRPGVTDEHGKPYDQGMLDEVFGIRQNTAQPDPTRGLITITKPLSGFSGRALLSYSDASLQLTTGQAHGQTRRSLLLDEGKQATDCPAVVVNRYGNGVAILLNCSLATYGAEWGFSARAQELLRAALAVVGVGADLTASPLVPGTHLYRFQSENSIYAGLLRDPPGSYIPGHDHSQREIDKFKSVKFAINLPREAHLYDMREGKYLGHTGETEHTLGDVTPFMLAALPYRVSAVDIQASQDRLSQGQTLVIDLSVLTESGAPPGLHVLQVKMINPTGEEVRYYSDNLLAQSGSCKFSLPLALNEAVGQWKILVRDVATGVTAATQLKVSRKSPRGESHAKPQRKR